MTQTAYVLLVRDGTIIQQRPEVFSRGADARRRAQEVAGYLGQIVEWRDEGAGQMFAEIEGAEFYYVDVRAVDYEGDLANTLVGIYIAPEGYLDTLTLLRKSRSETLRFLFGQPADPGTFQKLRDGWYVVADDPDDEGGYTHVIEPTVMRLSQQDLAVP